MMDLYNMKPSKDAADKETERKAVLKASLFLDALIFALLNYRCYMDREDLMWVNALTYRMQEPDVRDLSYAILNKSEQDSDDPDMDDVFKLAHMMLNQPYVGLLKHVSDSGTIGNIFREE